MRLLHLIWAVLMLAVGMVNVARAEGSIHPDLLRAASKLSEAARERSPSTYTALRRIWQTWDRANPSHVEETLRTAATDPALSPPERSYAGMLAAYARVRRGDLAQAKRELRALGYVDRWLILGPFDNEGKLGFEPALDAESEIASDIVDGRGYEGKDRLVVRWRDTQGAFPYGYVDFNELLRPKEHVCALMASFVAQAEPAKARTISAFVGVSGAFKLFWNGRERLNDKAYRGHDHDRVAVSLRLEPGVNVLALKVCGTDSAPVVSVRLADASGEPDDQLQSSTDLTWQSRKVQPGETPTGQVRGPLQRFEELLERRAGDSAVEESFARYLANSGGDDPAEHRSRDLAASAAERNPTVKRLLLAARLAEDRNQQATWLNQAEGVDSDDIEDRIAVELALAIWNGQSLHWQDAFPYFDRVLALDPDNLEALQGRVSLYNEAGLERTGLRVLERALQRNPHSVTLMNLLASQLRELGRLAEATEIERRYTAFRFDDHGYLSRQLELSLSRRNREEALRWNERLLELDPESIWARGMAARTYRFLGQPERAIAAYREALALAPADIGTLRGLADLQGELGERDEQMELLRTILKYRPQEKDTREYVEHIEPEKPRDDEKYAWQPKQFLKYRLAPAKGHNRRTLVDLKTQSVYKNGLSSQFRQVVFQPLTDSAAALSGQYSFQYEASSQRVQLRGARVFRADGRIDEAVESGEAAANNPAIAMYTSARVFYVQFPRLEAGDVVELRYRIDDTTPRNEFANYFGEITYFGSSEPVQHTEYVLITPKSRQFYFDVKRLPTLERSVKTRDDQRIYRFTADDLDAVAPEPAMPPWTEILGYVHVSTYQSYKELGTWYWGLAKDQFDLDAETRKLAREITEGLTTELDKVKAVYNWVIKNTRYVALEFGIYGYKPRRCVQTVARGWGDCKDKATVIVSLLRELGIDSTIVILRTQVRGTFDSKLPSLAPFDHAIAYVPSLDLYLDGTAELTGAGELPIMDAEALGILINEGDSKLVRLPPVDTKQTKRARSVQAEVNADGSAKLELEYEVTGSVASSWRRRYHAEATLRERLAQDMGQQYSGFSFAEQKPISTNDLSNPELPVQIQVKGSAPSFARQQGRELSIAATVSTRLTPSYASLSQRTLDVKIDSIGTFEDTVEIEMPPGFGVKATIPEAKQASQFGSFEVKTEISGNHVKVHSRLTVDVSRVTPKDYAAWRAFCQRADDALGRRLTIGPTS